MVALPLGSRPNLFCIAIVRSAYYINNGGAVLRCDENQVGRVIYFIFYSPGFSGLPERSTRLPRLYELITERQNLETYHVTYFILFLVQLCA